MKSQKLSVSLPSDLADEVREAAASAGVPLSAWVAEAAAARLRAAAFDLFLEEWEREHGAITDEELARAEEELGYRKPAAQRAAS